ncbi:unnamed protein product [[Candida] boidinii]|uniref:SWI5-dependent HO expression protein 3 n=1 Tax=Candida boidinii TaxID=5477 RepID=A0A9W6T2V3_CANBO|nr:unnamed protein product [[Candida] boidinii]
MSLEETSKVLPSKPSGTSRVIESLHQQIDTLTNQVNELNADVTELKQKNSLITRRNETLIEQLSNAKHQTEVSESLLKRKERRVIDLEIQLTDALSNLDTIKFDYDNTKNRMSKLQEKENSTISEYERLQIAYDMVILSQKEYKIQMIQQVNELRSELSSFINNREKKLNENIDLIKKQEPEILSSYKSVVKNSKQLELIYLETIE